MHKRFIVYPIALLVSLILLIMPGYLTHPQRNMRTIINAATANPAVSHQSFASYYKPLSSGYILVLYTGKQSNFFPIQYLTITKINKKLTVDVIKGAGEENVYQLSDDEALKFLEEHQLNLEAFDHLSANE